jgi:Asp-tRNA(Asn)/Glu-tRNA(Gln) amidotransferase A subunit family amidase
MGYEPTVVRTVARTFGFELTEAEARELAESAARFEQAAREVTPPEDPPTTRASDVRPGTDEFNAFNYRCSLGDGEGPLADLEVGVKDNIAVAGVPMTCGSSTIEYVPERSATVVDRLVDAGATIVGVTNMDEFAYGSTGEYCAHGRVTNPVAPGHVPGGSSSGSAAAVAAGLVEVGLGSDTGGSLRMPAAFSGVVGFKPTHRSVSRDGFVDLAPSLDHVGTLANTVENAARALEVMNGPDPRDPSTFGQTPESDIASAAGEPVGDITIGVIEEGMAVADEAVRETVGDAVDALDAHGVTVERIAVPTMEGLIPLFSHVTGAEFAAFLAANGLSYGTGSGYRESWREELAEANEHGEYGERVREMAIINQLLRAETGGDLYVQTWDVRRALCAEVAAAFEKVDALVCPTMPMTAPEYGAVGQTDSAPMTLANTAPFDMTGHPAISVPYGDVDGLPVGVQLIARWGDEPTAVRLASALESLD